MDRILKQEGRAKRAEFETVHGTIQTPVFMNVGTVAAIKGAVSTLDLEEIKTQVELSNTYHLHVRPGDKVVKKLGGLHKFMSWNKPILTDSGGFQVFSLAGLRKIKEEGVYFQSHIDGHKIFMGPEESMQIQSNLASTIAMAFDECAPSKAERSYVQASVERTTRWLERCSKEMNRLKAFVRDKDALEQQIEDSSESENRILILTEPLCDLETRKQIFQDLIEEYSAEGTVFLKPHPRDILNYRKLFPDIPQFDATVPMEMLNFFPKLHFSKVISVLTDIHAIHFADECVRLGPDFMDRYEDPLIHRQNEQIH